MHTLGKMLNTGFSVFHVYDNVSHAFLLNMVPEKKSYNISLAFYFSFLLRGI